MRSFLLALILAASAFLPAAAGAYECLSSSAAVFAAHPKAPHASWEGRSQPGQRCWFAGYPGEQRAPAPKKQATRKPQPQAAPSVPAAPIAAPPPAPVAPPAPILAPDSIEFALALAKAKIVLADRLVQFQAQRRKEAKQ